MNDFIKDGMKCPICGKGTLHFTKAREKITVLDYCRMMDTEGFDCDTCKEGFYTEETLKKLDEYVKEVRKIKGLQ